MQQHGAWHLTVARRRARRAAPPLRQVEASRPATSSDASPLLLRNISRVILRSEITKICDANRGDMLCVALCQPPSLLRRRLAARGMSCRLQTAGFCRLEPKALQHPGCASQPTDRVVASFPPELSKRVAGTTKDFKPSSRHPTPVELEFALGDPTRGIAYIATWDEATLSEHASVSVRALQNLESGNASTLRTLIQVLRALSREKWLATIAPYRPSTADADERGQASTARQQTSKQETSLRGEPILARWLIHGKAVALLRTAPSRCPVVEEDPTPSNAPTSEGVDFLSGKR